MAAMTVAIPATELGGTSIVRVMSYNVRYANPNDGVNVWERRKDLLTKLLVEADVEVFGLQEALEHQVADIVKALPRGTYSRAGVGREWDRSGEATPIFWKTDAFSHVHSETLWLSDTPNEAGSRSWGNNLPRIATVARLVHRHTGIEWTFINTHLDHESSHARVKSIEHLSKTFPPSANPSVLMGDFNASESDSVLGTARYLGWLDSLRSLVGPRAAGVSEGTEGLGTFTGFDGTTESNLRIDYILTSGICVLDANIIRVRGSQQECPSDHDPVYAALSPASVAATPRPPASPFPLASALPRSGSGSATPPKTNPFADDP